jgi:hypothetical protein
MAKIEQANTATDAKVATAFIERIINIGLSWAMDEH